MIKVEFQGVLRLKYGLAGRELPAPIDTTIEEMISLIATGREDELEVDLRHQSILVIGPDGWEQLHRLPGALGVTIVDGSHVVVVTPLTGG